MRTSLLALAALVASCTQAEKPLEWREAWTTINESFCSSYNTQCDFPNPIDVDECVRHNVFHLCELDQTCDDHVPDGLVDAVYQCAADIETLDCGEFWRNLPDSCEPLPT